VGKNHKDAPDDGTLLRDRPTALLKLRKMQMQNNHPANKELPAAVIAIEPRRAAGSRYVIRQEENNLADVNPADPYASHYFPSLRQAGSARFDHGRTL
jgi:hypothetical protein